MRKPKILIEIGGGRINAVYTDTECDVEIIDNDTEVGDEDTILHSIKVDNEDVLPYESEMQEVKPDFVNKVFKLIKENRT